VERLADGHFEVTEHPHRDLCLDCPARERLCSHSPAATMREPADPPIEPEGEETNPGSEPEEAGTGAPQLSLLEGQ
jgi:hypothetical protein